MDTDASDAISRTERQLHEDQKRGYAFCNRCGRIIPWHRTVCVECESTPRSIYPPGA